VNIRLSCYLALWATLIVLYTPAPALASESAFVLQSLSVGTDRPDSSNSPSQQVWLEASVFVSNAAGLRAALRDGASFHLDIHAFLEYPRLMLPNKTLFSSQNRWRVHFDPLTREYLLIRSQQPPLRKKELRTLLEEALGDLILPLGDAEGLPRICRAGLTLVLRYADVPPWLRKTLFFWSWDVIPATTFSLEFSPADIPCSETSSTLATASTGDRS